MGNPKKFGFGGFYENIVFFSIDNYIILHYLVFVCIILKSINIDTVQSCLARRPNELLVRNIHYS